MSRYMRGAGLVIIALALAGCGASRPAGPPGAPGSAAPASGSAAPQTAVTLPPDGQQAGGQAGAAGVCQQPGRYLTAVRTGQHAGYDRVVFEFSGGLPAVTAERVEAVYADPKGTKIPLPGQSYLRVVFRTEPGPGRPCSPRATRSCSRSRRPATSRVT